MRLPFLPLRVTVCCGIQTVHQLLSDAPETLLTRTLTRTRLVVIFLGATFDVCHSMRRLGRLAALKDLGHRLFYALVHGDGDRDAGRSGCTSCFGAVEAVVNGPEIEYTGCSGQACRRLRKSRRRVRVRRVLRRARGLLCTGRGGSTRRYTHCGDASIYRVSVYIPSLIICSSTSESSPQLGTEIAVMYRGRILAIVDARTPVNKMDGKRLT